MTRRYHFKTIRIVVLILLLVSLSFAGAQSTSLAEEKSTEWFVNDSPKKISSSGKLDGYARVVSTLFIVIALIVVTVFVLRKKYGIKTSLGKGKKRIQIIDHLSMGVKKSIVLVKVPGKHLLIGATNDRIGLISEIANEDVVGVDEIINGDADSKGEGISNKDFLSLMKESYLKHKQK